MIPAPRASISPPSASGAHAIRRLSRANRSTRSSATSRAPRSISRSARSDFPALLDPSRRMPASFGALKTAAASASSTQVAWMFSAFILACSRYRQFNDQPRAVRFPVFGENTSPYALRDLPRDGQAESRILAEAMIGGPLRIEAQKHGFQILLRYAGAFVFHGDTQQRTLRARTDRDRSAIGAERYGIVDEIAENLAQPFVAAQHARARGQIERQHDLHAARNFREFVDFDDGSQEVVEIDEGGRLATQFGVEPRSVGNIADEPVDPLHIVAHNAHELFA